MNSLYIEYCNPFDGKFENFWMKLEHIARYVWASEYIKNKNAKVLDASCANGYGTKILSTTAKKVVGYDNKVEYIKEAKENNLVKNVNYGIINLENPKKAKEKFDYIISFETLEHLKDYKNALTFFYDSLNSGGELLLSFPNIKFESLDPNLKNKDVYHLNLIDKNKFIRFAKTIFSIEEVLGQTITNIAINNEINKLKTNEISNADLEFYYNGLYDDKKLIYFAKILAWPNHFEIDESYSYIFRLKKY